MNFSHEQARYPFRLEDSIAEIGREVVYEAGSDEFFARTHTQQCVPLYSRVMSI